MSDSTAPRISFVVATDTFATVAEVLASLRDQPDPEGIEVVLACPSEAGLGESAEAPAGSLRIVEVGELVPIEGAFAAGIRAASAPVVLIGETHAFPERGALEPLIRAICDDGYAAVAPGLRNANPETAASWASLMVTYGWTLGERREATALSTHNTAYRRELLLAFGDELPALLRLGGDVHGRLRRQGHRLLVEPASVFAHQNVVQLRSCIGDRFHAARSYSASRSESWSVARRGLYAVAAPLIPLVIAARVVRSPGWRAHRSELPRSIFLPMAVSLAAHGAGELAAYAAGVGNSPERIIEYEIHRARHL
jgi:Glycosyl transferase family 2